eukprot:TRINITY_DN5493_c0_g2_i1.p1 TRINITY_DN5493_c0_g2~~TRINITY_DN5493_c0_g2_i1.p1  ORF type:complete len:365 (+),score=73.98 TRINITY_DN5493_c0_g2_i1:63-1157(+)
MAARSVIAQGHSAGPEKEAKLTEKEDALLSDARDFLGDCSRFEIGHEQWQASLEKVKPNEDLRRRMESVRFLAWQKAQFAENLRLRETEVSAAVADSKSLQSMLKEESLATSDGNADIVQAEKSLTISRCRCEEDIKQLWDDLDAREASIEASAQAATDAGHTAVEESSKIIEAGQISAAAAEQAELLSRETTFIVDLQQELETRDAALQCAEAAFNSLVGRSLLAGIKGHSNDSSTAEVVSNKLRAVIAQKVLNRLLRDDPRLGSCFGTRRDSILHSEVLRAVGGAEAETGARAQAALRTPPVVPQTSPVSVSSPLPSSSCLVDFSLPAAASADVPEKDRDQPVAIWLPASSRLTNSAGEIKR